VILFSKLQEQVANIDTTNYQTSVPPVLPTDVVTGDTLTTQLAGLNGAVADVLSGDTSLVNVQNTLNSENVGGVTNFENFLSLIRRVVSYLDNKITNNTPQQVNLSDYVTKEVYRRGVPYQPTYNRTAVYGVRLRRPDESTLRPVTVISSGPQYAMIFTDPKSIPLCSIDANSGTVFGWPATFNGDDITNSRSNRELLMPTRLNIDPYQEVGGSLGFGTGYQKLYNANAFHMGSVTGDLVKWSVTVTCRNVENATTYPFVEGAIDQEIYAMAWVSEHGPPWLADNGQNWDGETNANLPPISARAYSFCVLNRGRVEEAYLDGITTWNGSGLIFHPTNGVEHYVYIGLMLINNRDVIPAGATIGDTFLNGKVELSIW
jgi:hypothetical protein